MKYLVMLVLSLFSLFSLSGLMAVRKANASAIASSRTISTISQDRMSSLMSKTMRKFFNSMPSTPPVYHPTNLPRRTSSPNINHLIKSVNIYYENDYYHYGEYTPNLQGFYSQSNPAGSYLDGEHLGFHGWGISFQNILTKRIPIWYKASYSYLPGSGTYDEPTGPTNISHSSNMTRYGFRLGYVFHIGHRVALISNFGYQWVDWNRDLPGLNSDYYRLNYYSIGLKAYYIPPVLNNKLWLSAEAYYLNDINDTVHLGFTAGSPAYDPLYYTTGHYNLIMAPKAGYIIGLKVGYNLYHIHSISINPYISIRYEQNKMGRSNINNVEDVYDGYLYPNSYVEPSDQYNQLFLQFGLKFGF